MAIAVRLVTPALRVVPGEEAGTDVRVRNAGHLVDRVDLAVLGETAVWARVEPPQVNLLPGQEETVRVVFAPPRAHDVTAGQRGFAVRAASREDPEGSVAEEGTLTVAEFDLVVADIVPRASRAPRAGRHQLAVDNLSNHPLTLRLTPTDPDAVLDFRLDAEQFVAQPGTATFVRLRARPTTRFLRGSERQIPFEVAVAAQGAPGVVVPATVRQHAILPAWLFRFVLIVGLLAGLWVGLLKPRLDAKVRNLAGAEAARATAPLAPRVNELAKQEEAEKAEKAAAAAAASASPTPSASASATPTPTKTAKPTPTPTPKPGPVPVPAPGKPEPGAAPFPTRPVDFYKAGWVPTGETRNLGPPMPSRPETVVRVTKIVIEVPYGDVAAVTVEGIDEDRAERRIAFDGQRRLEIVPRGAAVFDADNRILARAECQEVPSERNPGPPLDEGFPEGTRACYFVVVFLGSTQDPSAPRPIPAAPTPSPSPSPEPSPGPLSTFERRLDL